MLGGSKTSICFRSEAAVHWVDDVSGHSGCAGGRDGGFGPWVRLRGLGPARAEETRGKGGAFALCARGLSDRLQCTLRSGPAAVSASVDEGCEGNEMLCVGGGDGDAAGPVFAGARRCSVGNIFYANLDCQLGRRVCRRLRCG